MVRPRSSSGGGVGEPGRSQRWRIGAAVQLAAAHMEEASLIHRVTKEIGGESSPTLTKTNYYNWAALMRVKRQARGMWIAMSLGTDDYVEDRMALEVLASAALPELRGMIANKPTAKIAWDAIARMYLGVERVRSAKANNGHREIDAIKVMPHWSSNVCQP